MPTTGTMRYLTIGDSTYEVYNTDTEVIQTYVSASGYTNWRPLVVGYSSNSSETTAPTTTTGTTYTFNTIKVKPSDGIIRFGAAALYNGSYTTTLSADTLTAARTVTVPDKSGVMALTSDIPDVSGYAPLASPTFTGIPTAPTPGQSAGDTEIATVKYVQDAVSGAGTGTVTSVGVANATNGGLSVSGSPITGSGTISVGHSNVLASAQTTLGIYPIKIDKNGHISEYGSAVSIPTKTSDLTNDSGFITGYTETDPIFSASAAAGITSTDISNWNALISDDHKWNDVSLNKSSVSESSRNTVYVPLLISTSSTTAYLMAATYSPSAGYIPRYDASSYLYATTPSANDNSTKVATTAYVDSAITALPEPMIFKGSLGTGGTITTLPAASSSNEGYTYKVITDGTYASQSAKVGDTFISDGNNWILIPSGDEPSGTVTSVGVSNATDGGLSIDGSPITSSGTISIGHSNVLSSAQTTQAVYPIKIDKNGHISEYGNAVSIPSISLNGSSTTSASFYAPIDAGTSGYYLKSNGSGAPTWAAVPSGTDEKLAVAEVTSGTTYYPIVGSGTTAATRQYDTTGFIYVVKTGTSSVNGWSSLILGNNKTSGTAGNKQGYLTLYGKNGQTSTLKSGAINNNSEIALPDSSGTLALQEDMIPIGSIPSTYMNILLTTNTADTKNKYYDAQSGLQYYSSYSTGGSQGYAGLVLGNNIASGTAYNAKGIIYLYGNSTYSTAIDAKDSTAARNISFPDKSGTVALTSDIPTVPTITLNGSSTTSPSFYAPTSAGTSGYYLKSNGSGAPTWAAVPTIPSNNVTGSGSTDRLAIWSGTNTLSSVALSTSSSYDSSIDLGTVNLYMGGTGQIYYKGQLVFYNGNSSNTITITPSNLTGFRTLTLPDKTGTIALTSDIPTVPTISLNGSSTTSASFYAPTSAGTSGQVLTSNGSGAPTWSAITVPTKTSDLTNDSGFITGMTILSYGSSTWQDFLDAYNAKKVVYCRASSNSNPASGSQTRLAFMAYVSNADNPTNVEFQYYRSVSTHTASQQGDQVYVYKLDKTAGWTVTVREASVKVVAGTGLGGTYSNGTMTLTGPTISLNGSSTTSASFYAPTTAGTSGQVLTSNGSSAPTWEDAQSGSSAQIINWTTDIITPTITETSTVPLNGYNLDDEIEFNVELENTSELYLENVELECLDTGDEWNIVTTFEPNDSSNWDSQIRVISNHIRQGYVPIRITGLGVDTNTSNTYNFSNRIKITSLATPVLSVASTYTTNGSVSAVGDQCTITYYIANQNGSNLDIEEIKYFIVKVDTISDTNTATYLDSGTFSSTIGPGESEETLDSYTYTVTADDLEMDSVAIWCVSFVTSYSEKYDPTMITSADIEDFIAYPGEDPDNPAYKWATDTTNSFIKTSYAIATVIDNTSE